MDEARKLGEFVQTSSELTELATKSIQLLHIDLRSGRTPDLSKHEERVGPMFEIMDPVPSKVDNLSSTIVQTSSYRRMPGQPKRSRILASSETRKKNQQTKFCHLSPLQSFFRGFVHWKILQNTRPPRKYSKAR